MSSKRTEPRSIASQLVLLFTPAAALLLCCALGVLYWIVVRHGLEEDRAVRAASRKNAFVRLDRAGERAFAMAEQFGFDEGLGELRKVQ